MPYCCKEPVEKSSAAALSSTSEICFPQSLLCGSRLRLCRLLSGGKQGSVFSDQVSTDHAYTAQYSASLTRSFEPLSRSIWYSPAPSHISRPRHASAAWSEHSGASCPLTSHGASAHRFALHFSCSGCCRSQIMDMDVPGTVVPIRVSADNRQDEREVVLAELQAKGAPLNGQAVLYCIFRSNQTLMSGSSRPQFRRTWTVNTPSFFFV